MPNNPNTIPASRREFLFSTGVKSADNKGVSGGRLVPAVGGGYTWVIPFECDDVPAGSTFLYGADADDHETAKSPGVIVRAMHNTGLLCKFAYFRLPTAAPAPEPPAARCPGCGHNFYNDHPLPDGRCHYCHEDDAAERR